VGENPDFPERLEGSTHFMRLSEKKLARKPGKGTALQCAEKLIFLKGTAFRPYITALK
jgi:hypothetical protein